MPFVSYDILLDDDLDLPEFSTHVTGLAITAQRVHLRLSIFLGEWMLDTSKGMDFYNWLTRKMSDERARAIGAIVRREIVDTPGVLRVDDYRVSLASRTLTITGRVICEDDESFDFSASPGAILPGNNQSTFWAVRLNTRGPIAPL